MGKWAEVLEKPAGKSALETLKLSVEPKENALVPYFHPQYEQWAAHKHSWTMGYMAALNDLQKLGTAVGAGELPLELQRPYHNHAMTNLLANIPESDRDAVRKQIEQGLRNGHRPQI